MHTGASNLEELHAILAEDVMVRRLKNDVLTQLPPKVRQRVWVEVTAKHKKAMKAISLKLRDSKKNLHSTDNDKAYDSKQMTFQLIGDLFNCSGKAKIPCVLEYMKDLLESNTKFIIFAHHQDVIEAVRLLSLALSLSLSSPPPPPSLRISFTLALTLALSLYRSLSVASAVSLPPSQQDI